jgi:hypothetical protein
MSATAPRAYINATADRRIRLAVKVWRSCPDRHGRPVGTCVRWLLLELAEGGRLLGAPVLALRRPAGEWVDLPAGGAVAERFARCAGAHLRRAEAALN